MQFTDNAYEFDGGYCVPDSNAEKLSRATGRFADKVALVTGGAGNFGSSCAMRLASEGAKIVLLDIREATATRTGVVSKFPNIEVLCVTCDITKWDDVKSAVETASEHFGRIDLLFNNAGYQGAFTNTVDYPVEDFQKVMDINVVGTFHVLKAVTNIMKSQSPQGGAIVQTASMAAIGAPPNMLAYASSKAAVLHMTRAAAKDLAQFNIRVNSVSPAFIGPGFMWSRQIELQASSGSPYYSSDAKVVAQQMIDSCYMRRYGSLDEVIGPVTFLLSDDASYLTGQDIEINGGM